MDTPLHVHEHEDELFYVLEGEHIFEVGEREFRAGPVTSCTLRAACPTPSAGPAHRLASSSSPPQPAWKDSSKSSRPRTARVGWVPRHTPAPQSTTA